MVQKTKKCKRCGRKLSDPLSMERGYGPVCWEKEGRYRQEPIFNMENERIAQLEATVNKLKKQIDALQAPMPNSTRIHQSVPTRNLVKEPREHSEIPVLEGGWDVSELKENPLFLKMQEMAGVA